VNAVLVGSGLGLLTATGVSLAVATSPPMRRPGLDSRIAPYLRDATRPSRLLLEPRAVTPFATVERLLGPVVRELAAQVDRHAGRSSSVRRRLEQLGRGTTLEQFRVEQVLCGAVGLSVGMVIAVCATALGSRANPLGFLVLAVVLSLAVVMIRDQVLTGQVARRKARILNEFPTIAEMLALVVGAGEGPTAALERIVRLAHGELSRELGRVLADVRAGASLVAALEAMAARTSVPALARFVDGVVIAVQRGTPLADVLRAQATDVREETRRALLEAGGRKEIAMLVPVVFLVLPVTVIFALFPGFYSLRLAVP
jgi:tight adherence protein C